MRYAGKLGLSEQVETSPGVWEDRITEQEVLGTMKTLTETHASEDGIHPKVSATRSIVVGALGIGPQDHSKIMYATYAGRRSELVQWLKDAAINRDRNLRMQYLAGMGLNLDESAAIYADILTYRRFPEDLFKSAEGMDSLRRAIEDSDR